MVTMYEEEFFSSNPKTLCDWVKNFRIKKLQMKRRLRAGGELRVCAILSTALLNAEHELRRKQQERFSRWMELQSKMATRKTEDESSASGVANEDDNVSGENFVQPKYYVAEGYKQHEDITNLWKYELSGLDEFMRNISSKKEAQNVDTNRVLKT